MSAPLASIKARIISEHMARIGSVGGKKASHKLDSKTARKMGLTSAAKRKAKKV